MLAIVIGFGFVVLGTGAAKRGAQILAGAIPLGLFVKNKEHERNMRLGINSEYEKHRRPQIEESVRMGIPRPLVEDGFGEFAFEEGELPPSLAELQSQKWILTRAEQTLLITMVCSTMLVTKQGFYAEETRKICEKYGVPYEELQRHCLSPIIADFDSLKWLSNNRLEDEVLMAQLEAQKKLLGNG